eukprot:365509-Chlamydomonas_euryale.AAC.30
MPPLLYARSRTAPLLLSTPGALCAGTAAAAAVPHQLPTHACACPLPPWCVLVQQEPLLLHTSRPLALTISHSHSLYLTLPAVCSGAAGAAAVPHHRAREHPLQPARREPGGGRGGGGGGQRARLHLGAA